MTRDNAREVAQLLSEDKYDLNMFLSYLRAIAVSGVQPDRAILLGILMQALARFHTSDFTACMCLVASHVQETSSVEKELGYMYELENILSCGEFAHFWYQWRVVKEHLPVSFQFETRVRTSILETIALTVERMSIGRLSQYLSMPEEQVCQFVDSTRRVQKETGVQMILECTEEEVTFERSPFNHPECNTSNDALKLSDIAQIL